MIEKNVMKTDEHKNSITFRVGCDCGSDDHDITIDFEKDEDEPSVYHLTFYKKVEWSCYWGNYNWIKRQWKKVKPIFKIIFLGYMEMEENFRFRDEDHINSFIKALEEGKKHMKGEDND